MKEIWKPIKDYEGLYEVSNLGRVTSLHHGNLKLLTLNLNNGYFRCGLSKEGVQTLYQIHRLVAETFISNELNKPQVNHKDGNKQNNRVDNLEWVTQLENMQHAWSNGLIQGNAGENNSRSKLSEIDVCFIRSNHIPRSKVYGTIALAKHFGVHRDTIGRIINGKYWRDNY